VQLEAGNLPHARLFSSYATPVFKEIFGKRSNNMSKFTRNAALCGPRVRSNEVSSGLPHEAPCRGDDVNLAADRARRRAHLKTIRVV
jgi:hypothetical protein